MECAMTDFAGQPLDDDDLEVIQRLAAIHAVLDPPPPDLDERVRFAITLDDIDGELARLTEEVLIGSGARGSERTRTITFDADSRTIMITVTDRTDNLVRLDGWLAPGAALRVELRFAEPAPSQIVTSDDGGRFVFDGVPHGLVQLIVHPAHLDGRPSPRVATPAFVL
jgi:hypothetical protein